MIKVKLGWESTSRYTHIALVINVSSQNFLHTAFGWHDSEFLWC